LELEEITRRLESLADPKAVVGMARFGIVGAKVYGVKIPLLRGLAKEIGTDHGLAARLWAAGSRESRILAALVDDPARVTEAQMESWVADLDSWEVCDQLCQSLFQDTALAEAKGLEWTGREEEFVKRAGFVLLARLALTRKKEPDSAFSPYLEIIGREAWDGRNYVKKALSWALRQIGKRSLEMNRQAVAAARAIREQNTAPARWLAGDALRELESPKLLERLGRKTRPRS
jgi:3-methyladenine DNA glycosylase AlkD